MDPPRGGGSRHPNKRMNAARHEGMRQPRGEMYHPYREWIKVAAVLVLQLGCAPQNANEDATPCSAGSTVACDCPDGSQGSARCNSDGNSVGLCQCAPGAAPAGGGASPAPPSGNGSQPVSASDLPCDVKAILDSHCANCHGSTPAFGAPMSLASAGDFRATAPKGGDVVGKRVLARIKDDALPMPPPPNARLSAADQATLASWINSGMPTGTCTSPDLGVDEPTGPGSGAPEPLPPDVTCYKITARASAAGEKYTVPTTPDLYRCFDYAPPWGDKTVQVVSAHPLIDNSRVLHHWILYNGAATVQDGANASCSGAHPNSSFITGWAPGGDGLKLPEDVGLRTEKGSFSLEMHYNNTAGEGQLDASGVEVCVTEKLRPKEAAVHWLGTQNLNKVTASGTCVPVATQPVTILTSSPHMHLQGRHMKTVVNRAGGTSEVLIDSAFDFNTQVSYPTPMVINPGDTLTTTCTYATPTPFGQKTNEEMCYNFVVAYPAGQLAQLFQILRKYDCTGL